MFAKTRQSPDRLAARAVDSSVLTPSPPTLHLSAPLSQRPLASSCQVYGSKKCNPHLEYGSSGSFECRSSRCLIFGSLTSGGSLPPRLNQIWKGREGGRDEEQIGGGDQALKIEVSHVLHMPTSAEPPTNPNTPTSSCPLYFQTYLITWGGIGRRGGS
ncbi:unnamed protein product [Pleuronectes platessa]|uniref:Uncharacterized protein n=1 Tax=Pleuronectes platessa TaxID=8262 RepID=A0A9N7UQR5_PLEPL|nr:unnamed protein product [Pleuronectes platessa]